MSHLKLTVLDQTPVHPTEVNNGRLNSAQTTVALAKACDDLGYARYWVAEHHNSIHFAGPCPEILIAHIAGVTKNMRVGSGGVMLSHYSPYKVAEIFNMLEALYPGRIDLAIGRAPGGDQLASAALAWPAGILSSNAYPEQAAALAGLLYDDLPAEHPWSKLHITPKVETSPSMWMLASSGGSAALAGQLGMDLALASFINPQTCSPEIFNTYLSAWQQFGHSSKPNKMLAVAGFCADTQEEAEYIAGTAVYRKIMARSGMAEELLNPNEVQTRRKQFSESQKAEYKSTMQGYVVGTPEVCHQRLEKMAADFDVDEIAIVTVTYDFDVRLKSYRLFSELII